MTDRPELVQFADLTPDHFRRHPVWIQCHVVDYDEPWHEETDEETFRPFLEPLPAGPEWGMLLVDADLTLADGTALRGFVTPADPQDQLVAAYAILAAIQPQLFLPSGRRASFCGGVAAKPKDERQAFYTELGRTADAIFPIQFKARPGLTTGVASGAIEGFYSISQSFFRRKTIVEQ